MTARLITAPTEMAVSLADAKLNLRIESDDTSLDALIAAWIEGITGHAEHYMGRAIINQTWRVTLDRFPDAVKLTMPPLVSVSHLKYYDLDNVQQTLDPQDYTVDSESEPGYIVPAPDVTWPDAYDKINAVEVQFVCGYGVDSDSTPASIKTYILARLVEQFDPATRPEKETIQSSYLDRLLDRYRVFG